MITSSNPANEALSASYIPPNYVVNQHGVFKLENEEKIAVCDPLYVSALARDESGNDWGKLLEWHDKDGRAHQWAMPNSMLAGDGVEYRRVLLTQGLGIRAGRKAQNALHDYIMSANPTNRAISTSQTGWNKACYVMPDGFVIGEEADKVLLQISGSLPKLQKRGSLESWKERVAKYAEGNSRLVFALSASLSGALLYCMNESSGGFHFSGGSSTGKTTALSVANSVWGAPLRSWRTTDNAAESWARFANDGFLAIDELGQVDPKSAERMAYMLGNGQAKGRANRDGIAKDTAEFRLVFLSTGEIGLGDKLSEDNKKVKAGQVVRLVEIPADAGAGMGVFENIHHFESANAFSIYLKKEAEENTGYAARAFLETFVRYNREKTTSLLINKVSEWMEQNVPSGTDGQVQRVARRFALVAVAGELAINCGIFPWKKATAFSAASACFKSWLRARGGVDSHEVQEGINALLQYLERHGNSRFQILGKSEETVVVHNRTGFKRQSTDDKWMYFITPETFRADVLGGSKNTKDVIKAAVAEGLIIPDSEGNYTQPRELSGLKKTRVLCIMPSLHRKRDATEGD